MYREGVLNREGVFAVAAPSCSESPCLYNSCRVRWGRKKAAN